MSDISEHDSDSDTETRVISKGSSVVKPITISHGSLQENSDTTEINENSAVIENSATENSNIVSELKQQTVESLSTTENKEEQQPEWQQYLQQNEETGTYTYTDETDGTVYEWDAQKQGWIPKIDDDFIALYQANYGFTPTGEHNPNIHLESEMEDQEKATDKNKKEQEASKTKTDQIGTKRKQEDKKEEWFDIDPKINNNVYVSGLPSAITDEEFLELMSKYGIIMEDDKGGKKIKLYKDTNGVNKGDGRCCYLKHESVLLACNLLDTSDLNGSTLHVEQAVFELKGEYDPSRKPKKKKTKKKKKKVGQEKLLDWVDRPAKRSKFDRIVILKNMFDHKEFEKDPSLILELKEDLRTEGAKYGSVKKVLIFDRNSEGVCSILFEEPEFADKCIEGLNGRYYAGKTVSAETYDGVTKYDIKETEDEEKKRLDDWENFLGGDDESVE